MSLILDVAGLTDVGCVRASNEDSFGYDLDQGIFVVCDGMGGHAAGEIASKIAVRSLLQYFHQHPRERESSNRLFGSISSRAGALAAAIQSANCAIWDAAGNDVQQAGMGSTVVSVLVDENYFSIGHVGDSRIYLIREGTIQQLTEDHSLVHQQTSQGLISLEEAKASKLQNIITKALGSENTVLPDVDDMIAISDDVLVLTSDGLTGALSDQEIMQTVNSAASLRQACENLVHAAKLAGGMDNITCLLIRFVECPWYQSFFRSLRSGGRRQWLG